MKIQAPCDRSFPAAHDSGPRTAAEIAYVVIHSEEASTALSAAEWFHNPASAASTQLAVDDTICYRCLDDLIVPWGAPPLNQHGLHVEQAGFSDWSKLHWLRHLSTIRRCAYKSAYWCHQYKIPAVWLTPEELRRKGVNPGRGKGGLTSHRNVTLAFQDPASQGHMDPGPNYPYSTYLWWVRYYLRRL